MRGYNFEIFDKFYNSHWFLTGYGSRSFSELLRQGGSRDLTIFIGIMTNDVTFMIFDVDQFNKAAEYYTNKLINNDRWRRIMYKKHESDLRHYFMLSEQFRRLPFSRMTEKSILRAVKPLLRLQEQVRIFGITLNGLVIDGRNHLSNRLRDGLRKKLREPKGFDRLWALLTQVTRPSIRQQRDMEIGHLARGAKKYFNKELEISLRNIYEKYCWLNYMYYGPPSSLASFKKEFRWASKQKNDLQKELQHIRQKQENVIKKYKLDQEAQHLVELAQHVLWQKAWRKDVEYHGFYCYEPMFKELAKRRGEKDWRNLLFMFPWELEHFILHSKPSLVELKSRRSFSCLVVSGPRHVRLMTGSRAKTFYRQLNLEKSLRSVKEVTGQCAYPGKVRGFVKIIQTPNDMAKMKTGDILVSQATSPDLMPALKKAAAIVTNTGGLICHAAIVARELQIPCVVGTKHATKVLKDGDLVEVDANNGIIRKIK